MRNWDNNSPTIPHPSPKSSSQEVNEPDKRTMAPNLFKNSPTDSAISQSKYSEKEKELSSSTSTEPMNLSTPTPFTATAEKKLLRKLDLHLIPFLALLYL
jgi:hypothetical protein